MRLLKSGKSCWGLDNKNIDDKVFDLIQVSLVEKV